MSKFYFTEPKMIDADGGAATLAFAANVAREVPKRFEAAVRGAGAIPEGEAPPEQDEEESPEGDSLEDEAVQEVAQVMQDIVALDDPKLLTESQVPRAQEINSRLGRNTSREERQAAWELIEG